MPWPARIYGERGQDQDPNKIRNFSDVDNSPDRPISGQIEGVGDMADTDIVTE